MDNDQLSSNCEEDEVLVPVNVKVEYVDTSYREYDPGQFNPTVIASSKKGPPPLRYLTLKDMS